jgi:hypothetical protein
MPGSKSVTLHCMRLANIHRVHPEMDTSHRCSRCNEILAIYPSGQAIIERYGAEGVTLICDVCAGLELLDVCAGLEILNSAPAPGSLEEVLESVPIDPTKRRRD